MMDLLMRQDRRIRYCDDQNRLSVYLGITHHFSKGLLCASAGRMRKPGVKLGGVVSAVEMSEEGEAGSEAHPKSS
jgi:hypothetical protein